MKKKMYLGIGVLILTLLTIDFYSHDDHGHAHFHWYFFPGFDILLGLIGSLLLYVLAVITRHLSLWYPSHAIILDEKDIPDITGTVTLIRYFITVGDRVKKGDPIAEVKTPDGYKTISSSIDGVVAKVHLDPQEPIDVGNILIGLKKLPKKSKKTEKRTLSYLKHQWFHAIKFIKIAKRRQSQLAVFLENISQKRRRTLYYSIATLGLLFLFLIDYLFTDHHHAYFVWHQWPGFDILFGLLGCLFIATIAVGARTLFLWRPTYSIILMKKNLPEELSQGIVRKNFVQSGDYIQISQPVSEIMTQKESIIVRSPVNGIVSKVFADSDEIVEIGNSLFDVTVSEEILFYHNQT